MEGDEDADAEEKYLEILEKNPNNLNMDGNESLAVEATQMLQASVAATIGLSASIDIIS